MSKTKTGISTTSITKIGKGENITTGVLIKICEGLNYKLIDIKDWPPDKKNADKATCTE